MPHSQAITGHKPGIPQTPSVAKATFSSHQNDVFMSEDTKLKVLLRFLLHWELLSQNQSFLAALEHICCFKLL